MAILCFALLVLRAACSVKGGYTRHKRSQAHAVSAPCAFAVAARQGGELLALKGKVRVTTLMVAKMFANATSTGKREMTGLSAFAFSWSQARACRPARRRASRFMVAATRRYRAGAAKITTHRHVGLASRD